MTLGIGNSRGADLYRDQHHLRYRNPPGHQRSLVGIARDLRRAGTFLLSRKPGFCDCQRGTPNWRIATRYRRHNTRLTAATVSARAANTPPSQP